MHNVRFISSHVMCTAYLQLTVSYNHYCDRFNSSNCFSFCFLFLCAETLPLLLLPFYRTDFALSVLSWINTAWYKLDPIKIQLNQLFAIPLMDRILCPTGFFIFHRIINAYTYIWIAENESENLNLGTNIETDFFKNASILIEQS